MRLLDLFAGIGGFSLGFERAGFTTVQFVEINPYCQAVLRQHWPGVPIHGDVRTYHGTAGSADVISGGFPCQDLSRANNRSRHGLAGHRSGLWTHFRRIICEVRPQFVVVENVPALLLRGLGDVLGDLATIGYDAEWHCIPAASVGAPHQRDRVWIVAYANCDTLREQSWRWDGARGSGTFQPGGAGASRDMADADGARLEGFGRLRECTGELPTGPGRATVPASWEPEPAVGRVAHGVPARVERLAALGNAIVPPIATLIGRAILSRARV